MQTPEGAHTCNDFTESRTRTDTDWSVFYVGSACKDWTLARVRVRAVAWAMLGDPTVTNGRGNRLANFTRGQVSPLLRREHYHLHTYTLKYTLTLTCTQSRTKPPLRLLGGRSGLSGGQRQLPHRRLRPTGHRHHHTHRRTRRQPGRHCLQR